jgi:hypothetical protein
MWIAIYIFSTSLTKTNYRHPNATHDTDYEHYFQDDSQRRCRQQFYCKQFYSKATSMPGHGSVHQPLEGWGISSTRKNAISDRALQ